MKNEFIRIGVAFVPPKSAKDLAMKLSAEISQKSEAFYILDEKNFYSHITIYYTEFPVYNLDKLIKRVGETSRKTKSIKFKFSEILARDGWIGIEAERSPEIQKIHEEVVREISPFHEGRLREKDLSKIKTLPEKEKNNLLLYGHAHMMELYHPHLTLIRLKDEKNAQKIAAEITWPLKEFTLDKIGIFKMGEHGTCVELIKEFKLK